MVTAAAVLGALAFGWLVMFQMLLAAGAPLGRMAWGGAQVRLDKRRRMASFASGLLAVAGCLGCLQVAGWGTLLPEAALQPMFWGFAALFGLSLVGNAISQSRIERLHGVPLTAILCGTSLTLALSG